MSKQISALRSLNFTYYATTAVLLPFLPIYFSEKGYDAGQVGMLMMIGPFVTVFAQPVWGYLSDRFQSVKWIIMLLWALTIGSSVGLFAASGFTMSFVFVLLLYFFMLPSVPLLDSLTLKLVEPLGQSYASVRIFGSIGFCVVAVLSGFLVPLFGGIAHIDKLYWLLWLFPLPILLLFLKDAPGGSSRVTISAIAVLLRNKTFLWYLFMIFVLTVPHRANDALFGLYLRSRGASDWMVSASWALAALCEAPGFLVGSRLIRRYHEMALLGIIALLYTFRWLLYAFVQDPWVLFALQSMHFLTFGLFWVTAIHYANRLVPEELRATGQSLLSAVFLGLAGIVGGFVGGKLEDLWGGFGLYGFGALLSGVAAILLLVTHAYTRTRERSVL